MSKHIIIFVGSVRENNYSSMAAKLVEQELQSKGVSCELIKAAELKLYLPGQQREDSSHQVMQEKVKGAAGIIFVSPEYHGGISSVTKLIIDNLGFPSMLAAKPVSIVGVAAGAIGALKSTEQIRSICSHVGAIVMPKAVSIAGIQKVFNEKGECQEKSAEEQIRGGATQLLDYLDNHVCPKIALESLVRKMNES